MHGVGVDRTAERRIIGKKTKQLTSTGTGIDWSGCKSVSNHNSESGTFSRCERNWMSLCINALRKLWLIY